MKPGFIDIVTTRLKKNFSNESIDLNSDAGGFLWLERRNSLRFVFCGQIVNREFYVAIIRNLIKAIRQKMP